MPVFERRIKELQAKLPAVSLRASAKNDHGRIMARPDGRIGDLRICLRNMREARDLSGTADEGGEKDLILRAENNVITFERA